MESKDKIRRVITYGTYDLLHEGHVNLLRRAKALGDYLIVGVTSDSYDRNRGKMNVHGNVLERVEAVRRTGLADKIVIEDYVGQKIDDIQRYEADVFAIGSDWEGKFDYLKEYCEVVYLPRTEGISSTMLREAGTKTVRLGVIGTGRIANRFMPEATFVSGVKVVAAYNPNDPAALKEFGATYGVTACDTLEKLFGEIDAVYIASPHLSHYDYIKAALEAGRHVLCEIPMVLSLEQSKELYGLARSRGLVLLEAAKTAFCPAFSRLVTLIKSGAIGDVVDIRASLSKLTDGDVRELDVDQAGGCMTELAPLPLLSILKILGTAWHDVQFFSKFENGVDVFTKGIISYEHAVATITLGLKVKTEGNLVVSGTKGYVYVPAPWWLTDFFEVRYEDQRRNKKYFYAFEGDGLRYELQEFVSMIMHGRLSSHLLRGRESVAIAGILDRFISRDNVIEI